jgi:hypothetical protein
VWQIPEAEDLEAKQKSSRTGRHLTWSMNQCDTAVGDHHNHLLL